MASAARDHLVLIQIEGMHCHRCESAIQRSLGAFPGVREVEVDFPSGQASVLHEVGSVSAAQLMAAVDAAGIGRRGTSNASLMSKPPDCRFPPPPNHAQFARPAANLTRSGFPALYPLTDFVIL